MHHAKKISSGQFSPDGHRVLTASEDGNARVWDAHTGERVLEPLTHQGPVYWARFSRDGSRIVTASGDGTAQVWEAQTGRPAAKPFHHRGRVDYAEFSPDGNWVVTMAGNTTCVWDVTSGEPLTEPLVHAAQVGSARFSPDSARVFVALHNGMTRIFSARSWTPLTQPMQHRGRAASAEFSPEAQRILTASLDTTARLWDADTGETLSAMQHDGLVWCARFSPDGLFAVTASADTTARIWDLRARGAQGQPMIHRAPVRAAEFSLDGECIVTASQDATALIWNSWTGRQQAPALQHSQWVVTLQLSPDGERVATGSADGTARIWNVRTGQPLTQPIRHGAPVDCVQFSPDGESLATASWVTNSVHLWNTRSGEPRGEPILHSSGVHVLRFSPDGRRLLSDDFRNDLAQIRDVESGRLLVELRGHQGWVIYAEFDPLGQRVVTASEDGTARIWNADSGQPLTGPLWHKGVVERARFSPDGRWVVTASEDTTGQVWDSHTGQPVGEPLRHRDRVTSAEFSPDGRWVVTASGDGTARLWDARTGRPVAEPFMHLGKVGSARFSPDGRRVLAACDSGEARLWDVPAVIRSADFQSAGSPTSRRQGVGNGVGARALEASADWKSATEQTGRLRYEEAGILLADLAEAVIGKRVTAQGALGSVSPAGLAPVRQRIALLPRDADFTRWMEWFIADRSTRTISPYSQIGLAEHLAARADETNEVAWREALMHCPTNGIAFAQMAGHHLRQNRPPMPRDVAYADWASRQAVTFAPERGQPWQRRIEVMEHTGAWTQLMAEAEQVIQSQPANAEAWICKSRCLTALGHFEAAAEPYSAVFWNANGLLHEKAGQIQQAEATFAKALEVASLPVVRWDFELGRSLPNWRPIHQMTNIIVEQGILSFDNTGGDPHFELYLPPLDGAMHRWFHVRMKNATPAKRADVFWGTVTDPKFHQTGSPKDKVIGFPILPNDPQFTVYTVDMGHQNWTNNRIIRLRLDPVDRPGRTEIDWICLNTDSKPPADPSGAREEITDPEMRRQALSNLVRLRRK